jgi:hypothetical protein
LRNQDFQRKNVKKSPKALDSLVSILLYNTPIRISADYRMVIIEQDRYHKLMETLLCHIRSTQTVARSSSKVRSLSE